MENEVLVLSQETALEVFTAKNGLDPYLQKVRDEIDGFTPDISTKKGRDAIASIAHKVAKSKSYLDGIGKELVDRLKEQPKLVDAERKRMRDLLDSWKDEVRRPLTDWENAEKSRVESLQARITAITDMVDVAGVSSDQINERIKTLEAISIDDSWQEFVGLAAKEKDRVISLLRVYFAAAKKCEEEAAELQRLREEEAKRQQQERERVIAEQAAEAAKAKAEAEAAQREMALRLEAERAERQRLEAIQAKELAEQRAKQEAADAVAREQKRIQDEAARQEAETAAREANKKHCAAINNKAAQALAEQCGITTDQAKAVVTAIAKGLIDNVKIVY